MAIQQSDIMDFGNGIIGDDTFDVWRKKTNGLRREIDTVNASLTSKINADIANLSTVYVPISGGSTSVSTPLQFTSAATFTQSISVGNSILTGLSTKLSVDTEIESATQLTSNKVKAGSQLILGTKTYTVPSAPAINNAVLTSATTNGDLAWQNAATLFANAGGLQQTTTVFEEVMPVGSIIALGGLTNDSNYLLCEGAFVSKDGEYSDLFDVIGYRYGGSASGTDANGNPFTDFQLPDYRGRVAVGSGTAGGFNSGALGDYGGDATATSTSNSILGIQHIPAHRHRFVDNAGNNLFAIADDNRGTLAGNTIARNTLGSDAIDMQGPNEVNSSGNSQDTGINFTTYTGGGANGSIHGGTTAEDDLSSLSGTTGHSHSITTANRVQPYIAVKWYIKAKQNTKIDFKIDIASSGLVSTTSAGVAQTVISPVNETIQLDVDPDNTSIALDNNSKVSIKAAPTIPGSITTTGPDFVLKNPTRLGGNSHEARALVHGNGNGAGDPTLNGYNRKVVKTIKDLGVGANNDTLIINYNAISPNSVGDYTGGVIINGMKAIMFEDGSILQSGGGSQKGNFKKATEAESGKHSTVAPQYNDGFAYIDDEDDVVIGGNGNGQHARGGSSDDGHAYRGKFMLPDDEAVDKLYASYHNTHVIAKSGKAYSVGYGYGAATTSGVSADAGPNSFHEWTRSFCESNNCKISKIVKSGDISSHVAYAIDEQGYFWGAGTGGYGNLANGTGTHTSNETVANTNTTSLIGKREALVNSETTTAGVPYNLATNRRYFPHPINPMLTSGGAITTNPALGVSLLKVTDATHIGSYNGSVHPDTVAILSENKRVHVAGYCDYGQDGAGLGAANQSHWSTVQTSAGVPLENITKLYSGGEDSRTYFVAIDENYDVWAWGDGSGKQFGNGRFGIDDNRFAQKIWDSASKNRRANYVITNNAGSGDTLAVLIIASHQDNTGATINKEFHMRNTAGTAMIRLSHTVFNTSSYSIQDLYFSNGNVNNFYYVLARNTSTNKLELWSSGENAHGNLGYQDKNNLTNFANVNTNGETEAYRVNFRSDLLEKVVTIHCCRQYNAGGNTFVHLSDGRIFAVGYLKWGFGTTYGTVADYKYKFSPIEMN